MVGDTKTWEPQAAQILDTHPAAEAFVKSSGPGFAIPYLHNGQGHEYLADFIIRTAGAADTYLILVVDVHVVPECIALSTCIGFPC